MRRVAGVGTPWTDKEEIKWLKLELLKARKDVQFGLMREVHFIEALEVMNVQIPVFNPKVSYEKAVDECVEGGGDGE